MKIPLTLLSLALTLPAAIAARAEVLASSNFPTNPAPADTRFTYNADQTLTAHLNTTLPTDKLLFPLAHPLTSADSFTVSTRFKIDAGFYADPNGAAQIAFGLLNSSTTGNDRSGGIGHDLSTGNYGSNGDTYDLVEFDYFPNAGGLTLSPTIVTSKTGTETSGAFSDMNFPWGSPSSLTDPGEGPLPVDSWLLATLNYDASSRTLGLSVSTAPDGGPITPLAINTTGADPTVIPVTLPAGVDFHVDSFALPLWTDSWADSGPSLLGDVTFSSFSVAAPEPASLSLLATASLLLLARRRR